MRNRLAGRALVLVAAVGLLAGCAAPGPREGVHDPLEPLNRKFFALNDALDKAIIGPLADLYVAATPEPIRERVYNFFDNLGYANTIVNAFLQGKLEQGLEDTGRLLVNSTLGLGGLHDLASGFGLERHDEDLGQTLGVWGFGEGMYLELPLLGPSTLRDAPGIAMSSYASPLAYADRSISLPLGVVSGLDQRARLDSAIRLRDRTALDPYVFQREAYRQHRLNLIYDGSPPLEDIDELERETR